MEAFSAFFFTEGCGIGSMRESDNVRKSFAKQSRHFNCDQCGGLEKFEKIIKKDNEVFGNKVIEKVVKSVNRVKKICKKKKNVKVKVGKKKTTVKKRGRKRKV